jgi:hypothetical protein
MTLGDVAVATITWARDVEEERLILDGLTRLGSMGMPVAISDGGSPARVLDALSRIDGTVMAPPAERGLVPQVKASLQAAAATGRPFLLYTESDKEQFFDQSLEGFISRAPVGNDVGVVVAARSAGSFGTFPALQRFAESTINVLTSDATGVPADYSYGPFLMRGEVAARLADVPASIGWGWRHYLFATAARLGLRVIIDVGDYPCPENQRHEDTPERIHRMRQLSQNVEGLVLAWTAHR